MIILVMLHLLIVHFHIETILNDMYVQQPANVNELNNFTCGRLKREGLLAVTVKIHWEWQYSLIVMNASKCLGNFQGWLLYSALALIPITLFFLISHFLQYSCYISSHECFNMHHSNYSLQNKFRSWSDI